MGSRAATDVALFLATSVVAYDLGGPAAVGLVGAVRVFPSMLTASGAALVTDRVHRPHVIAGVNAVFVLVALALAAGVAFGASLVFLVVVQAIGALVSGPSKPAMQALLPQLVREPGHLLPATATWGLIDGIGAVAGPVVATGLLFTVGAEGVFAGSRRGVRRHRLARGEHPHALPAALPSPRRGEVLLARLDRRGDALLRSRRACALRPLRDPAPDERSRDRLRDPLRARRGRGRRVTPPREPCSPLSASAPSSARRRPW